MKSRRQYDSPARRDQAEATRLSILNAVADLVVTERPSSISVPSVAARAGVAVRTVYHYFPNKEALFAGLAEWSRLRVTQSDTMPAATSPAELVALLKEWIPRLAQHVDFIIAARSVEGASDSMGPARGERTELIRSALRDVTAGLSDTDAERLVAVVRVLMSADSVISLTKGAGLSGEEAAETLSWAVRVVVDRARRTGRVAD